MLPRLWLLVVLISQALVGLVSRALNLTTGIFYRIVFLLKNEWSPSFPHGELEAWACVAHVALRCMSLGWLLLSQDISTLVLALSLLPGLSNAGDEKAPILKPGCVVPRFLLLISLSPRGELSVVARLPTVFFRWLGAIQNYLPLPYQMNGSGKVWPSLLVTESVISSHRRRQC